MKLLLYESDGVDQILMVVPDGYDAKFADEEAESMLPGCYRDGEWEIDEMRPYAVASYRVYFG